MSQFKGLRAAFVNCSLKAQASESHTATLMRHGEAMLRDAKGFPTLGNKVGSFDADNRLGYPLDSKGRPAGT